MKKVYVLTGGKRAFLLQAVFSLILLIILLVLNKAGTYFNIVIGIGIAEWLLFILWGYRKIWKPMKAIEKACQAFAGGYMVYDIFKQKYELDQAHEAMMQKMHNIIEQKELVELYRSQARYLALQNQINPHFLYNTLEGIRSEALIGGLPAVGEMAEVLAKFFRYTISNMQTMVSLEDEVANVRNYCQIQKYRFGDKISLEIVYEENETEKILKCRMPKLILQPIVENSIRHGIEPLLSNGIVRIRFQVISDRLVILVSDNGVGMKEEELDRLNDKLKKIQQSETENRNQTGGIGMINVNSRIKLLYGEEYGIRYYSTEQIGTDVEITLPFGEFNSENTGDSYEERSASY